MAAKPHITIVGAGNLGAALVVALGRSGYPIDAVVARTGRASLRRAKLLASQIGATAVAAGRAQINSDVVWFCVPDGQISRAARSLAGKGTWEGRVALHSSGALTSDELSALRRRGAAVASVHPLMTFVRGSRPSLAGVPFAIEGDAPAVRVVRSIVKDLRGHPFSIKQRYKAAYHAWGTFASPLLIALLATTERVAVAAGVTRKAAKQRMLPIIAETVANYAALGAAGAFSGPIVRGDAETLNKHLSVLQRTPLAREVYVALAKAALRYLPVKQRGRLKKMLTREK
jgi:predicted short-subunit dehydrogenase-like oxidoreductase (DUF2520 family)